MSDGPPPGYNPNVSMLQGGTAAITPQAGGGSPPGYDPSVSLLNQGNSGGGPQITPQAGGAMSQEEAEQKAGKLLMKLNVKEDNPNLKRALQFAIESFQNGESEIQITSDVKQILNEVPSGAALGPAGSPDLPVFLPAALSPSASGESVEPERAGSPTLPISGSTSAFVRPAAAAPKAVRFENGTAPGMVSGPIKGVAPNVGATPVKPVKPVPPVTGLAPITAEDTNVLQDPRLTTEEHAEIDELMKRAFQKHFETFGKEDLRTGRKTSEEVSKESAAAAVTAGTLLAQSILKDKAGEPGPAAESKEESSTEYTPFTRIINPSDAEDPFYVEYYRVLDSKSADIQYIVDHAKRNRDSRAWAQALRKRMDDYQRRRNTLWAPTDTGRGGKRAPELAKSGYSLNSTQILTQFDRASVPLAETAEGLTAIALPPVRGSIETFLRILKALQRIGVIYTVSDETMEVPRIICKPGIVLTFMPPFYGPVIDYTTGASRTSDNLLLLSYFLQIEAYNQDRIFVLPENTTDNYAVGVAFDTWRGKRSGAPLLNFLEPSYIYYRGGSQDGTDSILLSASATDVEKHLPVAVTGTPPRIFKPKPTANGKLGERTLVVRGDLENKHVFEIPQPHETSGSECVTKGLVKRVAAGKVAETPIYLKTIEFEDTVGSKHADEFLIAIRIRYDRSQKGRAICDYSASKTIPPPMPPDQFYGSKSAKTVGVSFTEVNFFESISKADRSPFYLVRKPGFGTGVFSDWQNLKFTVDEASLLNGMGLTPKLLEAVFGAEWPNQLANFLQGISITKCFTDTRLMLRGECQQNREFLDKVRMYYAKENLSVEKIQQKRDTEMRAEVKRYIEDLKASTEATADFPTGDEHLKEIPSADFFTYKKRIDRLYPYYEEPIAAEGARMVSTNIIIANRGGDYKYYKLSVPTADYEKDLYIFYDLIQSKRQRYPSLSFIY